MPSEHAIRSYFEQNETNGAAATFVSLNQLPKHVYLALHAAEDSRYLMEGSAWRKCAWNIVKNTSDHKCDAGLPTFAAKNMYASLSPPKGNRHVDSLLFTWKMESVLTRAQIIELVLNKSYFGNGAYGISDAANTYFGKSAIQLTVPEAALLVGILKAPSRYNPIDQPIHAKRRRNFVLSKMQKRKMISEVDWKTATTTPLTK